MKSFKYYDFWLQLLLIAGSLIYLLFIDPSSVFYAYALIVGWQMFSNLIHHFSKSYYLEVGTRKYYFKVLTGISIISFFLFLLTDALSLDILLFMIPLLIIWYTSICYKENQILKHKAFIHLK